MRERDRDGRTIKAIIKDSTDRELSKLSMPEMTPDMLRGMAKSAEKKKLRRYRKIAGAAAALVIVAVGAALVFNSLSTDVEADKNAKHEVVTEDGIIIEDEGWGNSSEDNWVITDWSEVEIAKETIPELIVPKYIPKGYEFSELLIEQISDEFEIYQYTFNKKNDLLKINQVIDNNNTSSYELEENPVTITCSKGKIYLQENNKRATIFINDGNILEISGTLSDDEFIKIIELSNY